MSNFQALVKCDSTHISTAACIRYFKQKNSKESQIILTGLSLLIVVLGCIVLTMRAKRNKSYLTRKQGIIGILVLTSSLSILFNVDTHYIFYFLGYYFYYLLQTFLLFYYSKKALGDSKPQHPKINFMINLIVCFMIIFFTFELLYNSINYHKEEFMKCSGTYYDMIRKGIFVNILKTIAFTMSVIFCIVGKILQKQFQNQTKEVLAVSAKIQPNLINHNTKLQVTQLWRLIFVSLIGALFMLIRNIYFTIRLSQSEEIVCRLFPNSGGEIVNWVDHINSWVNLVLVLLVNQIPQLFAIQIFWVPLKSAQVWILYKQEKKPIKRKFRVNRWCEFFSRVSHGIT